MFQGSTSAYVIPLMGIMSTEMWKCPEFPAGGAEPGTWADGSTGPLNVTVGTEVLSLILSNGTEASMSTPEEESMIRIQMV